MPRGLKTPFLIVNFKTYLEATGEGAVRIAKEAERVSLKTNVPIGVAPQLTDIATVTKAVGIPVFAQHIDPIRPGSYTGYVLADAVKEAGAIGTIINHSERQLTLSDVNAVIEIAREKGLISVVCASNPVISAAVAAMEPDVIAIEPPELIGTGIPVSKVKPEAIMNTVKLIRKVSPTVTIICGAGIHCGEDVVAAMKLGAQGVLTASGVVKSGNPYKVLYELAEAMKVKRASS